MEGTKPFPRYRILFLHTPFYWMSSIRLSAKWAPTSAMNAASPNGRPAYVLARKAARSLESSRS
jgi:hypothetical protein